MNGTVDDVLDELRDVELETGESRFTVFRDWLDLMVYAYARDDPSYLEIVDRYEDRHGEGKARRCLEHYAAALGELVFATAEVNHEVLGVVYEQLGMQSDAFGQHFTPHGVSDAVAAMNFAAEDVQEVDPPLTVHDPACGSGRLLISVAKHLHGLDEAPPAVYSGQDKDAICAKMTALNLALANLPGRAVLGDSLTLERRRIWYVDPSAAPPITIEDAPEDVQAQKAATK